MSDQNQIQLSEKVTPTLLDRMYNNFVKITDWVVKGKESKYPLPKALAGLFDGAERNQADVAELKQLVTTLQASLIDKEQRLSEALQRITALDGALQNVNATVKQLADTTNTGQAPQAIVAPTVVATPTPQPAAQPQPASVVEVTEELVDLDDVVGATPSDTKAREQVSVSPNEQAIQVSAEAVDAGNIDPASYQALDAEISALLG